jgi:hypothetical protein
VSTHTGQGFAKPLGAAYRTPDRDELARRAAKREAEEREARAERLADTEEGERRAVALNAAIGAALRTYHDLGGQQILPPIQWGPEPDPNEDVFEGIGDNQRRES